MTISLLAIRGRNRKGPYWPDLYPRCCLGELLTGRQGTRRDFEVTLKEISGGPQTPKRDCLPEHLPSADGLEGVADVVDSRRRGIVGPDDGHHVEAAALLQQTVPFEIVERGER